MLRDRIIAMFSGKSDSKGRTNLNFGRGIKAVEWATKNPATTEAQVVYEGGKAVAITDQGFIELATELVGGNLIGREGQIMLPFIPHLYGKHNHGWGPPVYAACEYAGDETTLPAYAAVVVGFGVSGEGIPSCSQFQFQNREDFESDGEYHQYLLTTHRPMGIVTGKLENGLWLVQLTGLCYAYTDEVTEGDSGSYVQAGLSVYPKPDTFVVETSGTAYCANNLGAIGVHRTPEGEARGQLLIHLGASVQAGVPRFLAYGTELDDT